MSDARYWLPEVAAIKVHWHPNRAAGIKAEATALLAHKPKYNTRKNSSTLDETVTPDGRTHCPRCSGPKQRSHAAYCNACANAYQKERTLRIRAGTWR